MKYSLKAILLIFATGAYAPSVGPGSGPGASGSGLAPTPTAVPSLLATDSANDKSKSSASKPITLKALRRAVPVDIFQYFEPKDLSKMRNTNRVYAAQGKEHILPRAQNASTVDEVLKWVQFVNLRLIVDKLKSFAITLSDEQLDAVVALSMPEHSTPAELQALKSLVKFLLTAGADVNAENELGWTRLFRAILHNNIADLQALLKYDQIDVNAKDEWGGTPLRVASQHGRVAVVKLLLEKKANVNAKGKNGWTPLYAAAYNGHAAVVQVLLKYDKTDVLKYDKTDVNITTLYGRTPLYIAAADDRREIVQVLLSNKADVNAKDIDGRTPLWTAAGNGRAAVVTLLLENGAEMNISDTDGWTPAMAAREYGHEDLALLLEEHARIQLAANQQMRG